MSLVSASIVNSLLAVRLLEASLPHVAPPNGFAISLCISVSLTPTSVKSLAIAISARSITAISMSRLASIPAVVIRFSPLDTSIISDTNQNLDRILILLPNTERHSQVFSCSPSIKRQRISIRLPPYRGALKALKPSISERGNQRERDRERAQARAGHKSKHSKNDGLTPEQRRERDAKALQEKAARKAAQAGGGNNAVGGDVTREFVVPDLSSLISCGLQRWVGDGKGCSQWRGSIDP
ncbi:hypothetical protein L484_003043 [Morus notabilis]|uniref:Small EDRK-rich factor-like N-terminal domain-containing protein n=1 Tax=Morus notabilis TaxID=981085 RepID=W9SEN9_9ROSA|nr:hypothetical protein L484_003043 [Morus notabilis]